MAGAAVIEPAQAVRPDDQELQRFYRLPDLWMGAELLRFSRRMREILPQDIVGPLCCTVERRLLCEIIPELAHRLGVRNFRPGEASSSGIRSLDAFDLRIYAAQALTFLPKNPSYCSPNGWSLITRNVCTGNILAIALDRAAPPTVASDWVAATIDRACNDLGIPGQLTWGPQLLPAAQRA